jgi:AraC-like DNA-binding protein
MVCNRCIIMVKQVLEKLGVAHINVQLGEIELEEDLSIEQLSELTKQLHELGFELIDDRKKRIIEKIKNRIIKLVHQSNELPKHNISDILSEELHYDYNYLSSFFSEIENTTIEKYIISQKVERVKELLVYDELTLNEIADQMGYSSVAHLSNQFKKVTGLTPGYFKKIKENKRKPLDEL